MASKLINEDVIALYNSAGLDIRGGMNKQAALPSVLKDGIKKQLRLIDEQDAVNRFRWYNLPCDVSSQELERLLYYKGQLCFFYFKEIDEFLFMPYALDGPIDFYGRYTYVKPIPIAQDGEKDSELYKRQSALLSTKHLKVLYDVPLELNPDEEYCILLHDYSKQWSQTIIGRQQIQDPLLDCMANCIPFLNTALLNATGVNGMKVSNTDEESNVKAASRSVNRAALNGEKWIPITANLELQELTAGATGKAQDYLMAMESLDNFRLSCYGIENGGLFQKKAYQNTMQTAMNGGAQIGAPLQDGLSIRQRFCDIVNCVFGAGISCEISQQASGADTNLDGLAYDEQDQSGMIAGDQPVEVITND